MASPTIAARATTATASDGTHTVSLPASIGAGDTLLIFGGHAAGNTVEFDTPSGWSLLKTVDQSNDAELTCFYKKATGSEGSTVVITSTNADVEGAFVALRSADAADPTVDAPEVSTGAIGDSATPDADGVSGLTSDDYLAIAAFGQEVGSTTPTKPSGYGTQTYIASSTPEVGLVTAEKAFTSTAENPGAWAGADVEKWAAFTVALYPGATAYTEDSTEPVGVTDSTSREAAFVRSTIDAVNMTDATARAVDYVRVAPKRVT